MVGNRWRVLVCGLAGFGTAAGLLVILTLEGGSEQELKGFRDYWFFVGLCGVYQPLCVRGCRG